ncbi:MAG: hypothetical protein HKN68_11135, partial [Saprospiraceae bacterium]|nr:hypothetical protein [Saprospiraceae bacterium]
FTPIFDNEMAASIGDIKIYQKNPDIIYVATGEGNPRNSQNSGYGMFKSMDGGRSWSHLGLENTRQIHRIIIHPDDPERVVVGVSGPTWGDSDERGVYTSSDGGETWNKTLFVNNRTGVSDLVVDPSNPNHMIVGMWEHRRWPWFFKSGGEGSGVYRSTDGGESWNRINGDSGLPTGEIGRIGLSFAPSKPDYIYAYIESKENAIYQSVDGGYSWSKRSKPGDELIGNRPFYYADIYVDVVNENRIYSIATIVTVSDDGGKTWSTFAPGNKIHTDHHAWWAHPSDPEFLIIGHDGGLNITQDRGKNWWFADNLPLAQFYHIRVDNAFPYNVMGGLQDNGSWRGPSQTWFKGGIRNMYWQRLSVGDGFDVVPDPLDNDYGYAMGQAGNLIRWHAPSGYLKKIKPVHPDGDFLRFNWNAGIAIDPNDKKTIYYGSQYLHKSSDNGDSWEIISPDLTTDDPKKQEWLETGGLTYDVTGAENHTTIISIDPSPVEENVIWVGTDDGNLQVTRDGGANWSNVASNIDGVPPHTWVTQVNASKFSAGTAVVVFDDHRRNNWEPYVFRTEDYGKSWKRLVDDDVRGYTYCFVEDPVEPNLMFVGTEFGLYVSFDRGDNWNEWEIGLPTMPVSDLVIHPREHDLVIGTFGRSIWIMDDIRPLRAIAAEGLPDDQLAVFTPPDAHLMIIGESIGYRDGKIGDALYNGANRPYGALISYFLKQGDETAEELNDLVKIEISDIRGKLLRTLYQKPVKGINRINWKLTRDAMRGPNQPRPNKKLQPRDGSYVSPGKYTIKVTYKDNSHNQQIMVHKDPRLEINDSDLAEKAVVLEELETIMKQATETMDEIRENEKSITFIKSILKQNKINENDAIYASINEFEGKIKSLKEDIIGKKVQGIYRQPDVLSSQLFGTSYLLDHPLVPMTSNQRNQLNQLKKTMDEISQRYNEIKTDNVKSIQERFKELNLDVIKLD